MVLKLTPITLEISGLLKRHVIKPGMETGNEMKRNEMKRTRNVTKL